MKKILVFGSLPPPVGGVRIFVKKLTTYFKGVGHKVHLFPSELNFNRYDTAYINYSSPLKRMIASLIAFFFSRKCFIISHSSIFDINNLMNYLAVFLSSGVVATSEDVVNKIKIKFPKKDILIQEGLLYREFLKCDKLRRPAKNENVRLLFYQQSNRCFEGRSIYGADLMYDALEYLPDDYLITWIDLSGEMKESLHFYENKVSYYSEPLDISSIYENIDILVRPTAFDGTAFMIVEALASGVKVLCSDVVKRPKGVYLFKIADGISFAEEIKRVAGSNISTESIVANETHSIKEFEKFTLG